MTLDDHGSAIDPRDAHLERTDEADDDDRRAAYYERQCEDYQNIRGDREYDNAEDK